MRKYYDITVPIGSGMITWPGDAPVRFTTFKSIARGDASNVQTVEFSTHVGSHVDAPLHFGHRGCVDRIPLDSLIGPAVVVGIRSRDVIRMSDLETVDLAKTKRILFKTRNSKQIGDGRFHADYVALSAEAAKALRKHRVRLVGIDALGVDPCGGGHDVHHTLLGAGIVILENINLSKVPAGKYELICLPIKLTGADGAPARVVLVRE